MRHPFAQPPAFVDHVRSRPRGRRPVRALGAALLAAAVLAGPAVPLASAAPFPTSGDGTPACAPGDVTVVVDLTDLGGEVEVGCASDAATGTDALTAAGFTEARDPAGFICAINGLPDPCPAEFTGSYWAYWHAAPDGEWEVYGEGSDTSSPQPGHVEGWRYNDGSQAPGVAPSAAVPSAAAPSAGATSDEPVVADDAGTGDAATDDAATQDAGAGPSPAAIAAIVLIASAAVVAAVIARRRPRSSRADGPAGQD